jgi:hypothetical protein
MISKIDKRSPILPKWMIKDYLEAYGGSFFLIWFLDGYIFQMERRVGIDHTSEDLNAFNKTKEHFLDYLQYIDDTGYPTNDMDIHFLNQRVLGEFEYYLLTVVKLPKSATLSYLQCLNKIILIALAYGESVGVYRTSWGYKLCDN